MDMATTTDRKDDAMTTEQTIEMTAEGAITIADWIADYRTTRDKCIIAKQRADAAFEKYERGEYKVTTAVYAAERTWKVLEGRLERIIRQLGKVGITADMIDERDGIERSEVIA
jgi:hypothetical protein